MATPEEREFTLLAGVGNSMGWFGIQADRYFGRERFSVFAGLGYTPSLESYPSGVTFAAGGRAFLGGGRHRGFLELSVSQISVEDLEGQTEQKSGRRFYGPGFQVGYQYTANGGLTFMASIGLGYAMGVDPGAKASAAIAGIGLGYTWR